jgi:hypothetical protein
MILLLNYCMDFEKHYFNFKKEKFERLSSIKHERMNDDSKIQIRVFFNNFFCIFFFVLGSFIIFWFFVFFRLVV